MHLYYSIKITNTSILHDLNRILKHYIANPEERKLQVDQIILQYSRNSFIKYPLDAKAYLILSKDERNLLHKKRYSNSPFPLLSNMERFSKTIGSWNEELQLFGLKTREKLLDHSDNTDLVGNQIHLCYFHTHNNKANKYLKRQYRRLEKYRSQLSITNYWKLSWNLMSESFSFRTASLSSWRPLLPWKNPPHSLL